MLNCNFSLFHCYFQVCLSPGTVWRRWEMDWQRGPLHSLILSHDASQRKLWLLFWRQSKVWVVRLWCMRQYPNDCILNLTKVCGCEHQLCPATNVRLPMTREYVFGFNTPYHCLVRVCLMQCMHVWLHNGCTQNSHANNGTYTRAQMLWTDALKPKSYSLVEGNWTIETSFD